MSRLGVLFPQRPDILEIFNIALTIFFSIELFLRFLAERKTSVFFRRYWLDIIAVLAPYFRSLRILRVLRLLRIFRLGKLLNRRFSGIQSWVAFGLRQQFWLILIIITLVIIIFNNSHIKIIKIDIGIFVVISIIAILMKDIIESINISFSL